MKQKFLVSVILILCFGLSFANMKMNMKDNMMIDSEYIQKKSSYNFKETVETVKKRIIEKGGTIFYISDHKKNADEVHLELRPATVIIFGNPSVGTFLMQENQKSAFELPLRILIYENEKGEAEVIYYNVKLWEKKFGIKNEKILANIANLYDYIVPSK